MEDACARRLKGAMIAHQMHPNSVAIGKTLEMDPGHWANKIN